MMIFLFVLNVGNPFQYNCNVIYQRRRKQMLFQSHNQIHIRLEICSIFAWKIIMAFSTSQLGQTMGHWYSSSDDITQDKEDREDSMIKTGMELFKFTSKHFRDTGEDLDHQGVKTSSKSIIGPNFQRHFSWYEVFWPRSHPLTSNWWMIFTPVKIHLSFRNGIFYSKGQ